jgi:hypothetical protein
VGGSVREWNTTFEEPLVAESTVELKLVLTNFNTSAATVAVEVVLIPA